MKYTKHGLSRMVERVVYNQKKKFNKKQITKKQKIAMNKFEEDNRNKIAIFNDGMKVYIYSNLNENNECTKYVLINKKIITVVKVNFLQECKKYKLRLFDIDIQPFFAKQDENYTYICGRPNNNDMTLCKKIDQKIKKVVKIQYININEVMYND